MLNGADKIEGMTAEMLEQINTLSAGMSNKNQELLDKLALGKEGGEASAAELTALKLFKSNADIQKAKDAEQWGEADKLKDEAHTIKINELTASSEADRNLIKTLLIDNGLSDALDAVSINPALKAGAIAMLHAGAIVAEGKAMIGDKSLSDAVKEWADSDIGKAYTLAADNNGAGSPGASNGQSSGKWADYTTAQLSEINKSNPEQYEQLKTTR